MKVALMTAPKEDVFNTADERFHVAIVGPLLSFSINFILMLVKAFAGIFAGSAALLADAGHSGADMFNSILVLASIIYSRKPADVSHPYGHDRAEVVAAVFSSFILCLAALFFGWDSLQKVIHGEPTPTWLAFWVAFGTLIIKVILVPIISNIGNRVRSLSIRADARDHLSDVFSSGAVIIGVSAAQAGYPRLDGVAGLAIALLIIWTAFQIAATATDELMEHNLEEPLLASLRQIASTVPEVMKVNAITGRVHGHDKLVQISIEVDSVIPISQASLIAEQVRQAIFQQAPDIGDVLVELNTNHEIRLRQRLK